MRAEHIAQRDRQFDFNGIQPHLQSIFDIHRVWFPECRSAVNAVDFDFDGVAALDLTSEVTDVFQLIRRQGETVFQRYFTGEEWYPSEIKSAAFTISQIIGAPSAKVPLKREASLASGATAPVWCTEKLPHR